MMIIHFSPGSYFCWSWAGSEQKEAVTVNNRLDPLTGMFTNTAFTTTRPVPKYTGKQCKREIWGFQKRRTFSNMEQTRNILKYA